MANLIAELAGWAAGEAGLTMGTDCFHTHLPDTEGADPVACFYLLPGPRPPANSAYTRPNVQVNVRSGKDDPDGGHDLMKTLFDLFHGLANLDLASFYVFMAHPLSGFQSLGRDEAGREEYAFTSELMVREK